MRVFLQDGHSLLHWASNKGHLEVVAFLVKDLLVDVNAVDKVSFQ